MALLAALRRRDRTGDGCFIEAAQIEAPVHLIADRFLAQNFVEADLAPAGNRSYDVGPHGCYPCKYDEWIALAVDSDAQWLELVSLIDEPWTMEAAFNETAGRVSAAETIDSNLVAWTRRWTVEALEAELRSRGLSASRMMNSDHLSVGPGNAPGGIFAEVDHPCRGPARAHRHAGADGKRRTACRTARAMPRRAHR